MKKYPKLEAQYEVLRGFDWDFTDYYPDKGLMILRKNISSASELCIYDYCAINKNGEIISCDANGKLKN